MSRKFLFDSRFWNDPWVVDQLSIVERHLFFYLFSNDHANIAGVYEISLRTISNETGFDREEVIRMLKRLEPKVKYVNGWVVVRNAIKNQNYHSSNVAEGIKRVLEGSPKELVDYVNWPEDFAEEKPKGTNQTQLIEADLEQLFGPSSGEKKTTVDKNRGEINTTEQGVTDGIPTVGVTTVTVTVPSLSKTTVSTTGKKLDGKSYAEANVLYEQLGDLVNEKFRSWYCKVFYQLGHERVMILASQARADGEDPQKLFSKLLSDESEKKKGVK